MHEVIKTGRLVSIDCSAEALSDIPSLQEVMESEMYQKIQNHYLKILLENNLDPAEYEPVIEGPYYHGDDFLNNRMQVKVSARQKIKLVSND